LYRGFRRRFAIDRAKSHIPFVNCGPTSSHKSSAADRGEYRQAAGAAAQLAICSLFIEIGGGLHLAFPMGGGRTFVDAKAKL
jgi:hypothetical protein